MGEYYWDNQIGTFLPTDKEITCPRCFNTLLDEEYLREVGGEHEFVCDSCIQDYSECECCGNLIDSENTDEFTSKVKDRLVCTSCYEQFFFECQICGETIDNSTGEHEYPLCNECRKALEYL